MHPGAARDGAPSQPVPALHVADTLHRKPQEAGRQRSREAPELGGGPGRQRPVLYRERRDRGHAARRGMGPAIFDEAPPLRESAESLKEKRPK